jgi:tetratricopeptide (TPR) repeat protein
MSSLPRHVLERLMEAARPMLEEPRAGSQVAHYRIVRELGRGAMGVVYEAFDLRLERCVALKVLGAAISADAEVRRRFVREAQAAARLSHPNIAAVHDAGEGWLAMQLVDGAPLSARTWSDPRQLARLLRDAARAVHYAHRQGFVHRDLKPGNLLVTFEDPPRVFVTDFGLAKELAVDSSLSLPGQVLGTPAYMPPEQARGASEQVDARSDVYALGATLFHGLCGEPPFPGGDVLQVLKEVIESPPPRPSRRRPAVDRDLEAIALNCLEKDPARRYATADELADDLDRFLLGDPVRARPPSAAYELRRYLARRRPLLLAGAAAALLAIAALVAFVVAPQARRAEENRRRAFALAGQVARCLANAKSARRHGEVLNVEAQLEQGIAACREALAHAELAHAWLLLGRLERARGRRAAALGALDRALELDGGLAAARFERGLVRAAEFGDAQARALVEEGEGVADPESLAAARDAALFDLSAYLERGGEARSADVDEGDELLGRASLAWLGGDLEAAGARLRELLRREPENAEAHLTLSRVLLLQGEEELAMRYAGNAVDLRRGLPLEAAAFPDTRRAPPQVLEIEGLDFVFADLEAQGGGAAGSPEAAAYGRRGLARVRDAARAKDGAVRLEALDLAVADFLATLSLKPELVGALVNRGSCHAEREALLRAAGRPDDALAARGQALRDLEAAVVLDPRHPAALLDRALLRLRAGQALLLLDPTAASGLLRGAEFDAESCAAAHSDWKAPRELLDRIRRAR